MTERSEAVIITDDVSLQAWSVGESRCTPRRGRASRRLRPSTGVEAVRRVNGDRHWLFLINHVTKDVGMAAHGRRLVSGTTIDGTLTVRADAVAVVRETSAERATPPA